MLPDPSPTVSRFLEKHQKGHVGPATVRFIEANRRVKEWFDASTHKPTTRYEYADRLRKFFGKFHLAPDALLAALNKGRESYRETKIAAKTCIARNWQASPTNANLIIYALRDFTKFHEVEPPLVLDRLPGKRKYLKARVDWDTAMKIIELSPSPYREGFQFMLWSALDEYDFGLINSNAPELCGLNDDDLHASIEEQRLNPKPYIRINLPPRKKSSDIYYILTPKMYVPKFPLISREYRNRGNQLLASVMLQHVWRRSAKRAKVYRPGFGPHHLRTVFRTRCAELGIPEIGEWMMGRGGDIYGYDRSGFDEAFLVQGPEQKDGTRRGGLNILWGTSPVIDRKSVDMELAERDAKIERLEAQVNELGAFLTLVSQRPVQRKGGKKEPIYLSWDPDKLGKYLEKARSRSP